ncbi:MAG: PEP-CTERM sorting domain-containing protein [Phycisphaerae bacterium]
MNRFITILSIGSVFSAAAIAEEGHVDVMPVAVIGDPSRIETGSFDFDGFAVAELPSVRVYENDLEDLPGADLYVGEAGVTAPSATAAASQLSGTGFTHLPGGVDVRFNFRTFNVGGGTVRANLWYWNGADANGNNDFCDDVSFAPASGVSLTFDRNAGLFSASADGADQNVPGFVVDTTLFDDLNTPDDETGFMHLDLDAILDDGDLDELTPVPAGIYAISLDVFAGDAAADPIFWLFNAGLGESGEPAAECAAKVVPEPTSLALLVLGAAALLRRRS